MSDKAMALKGLTPRQIEVLALRACEGRDLPTIALRIGGSVQNVSKIFYAGLTNLRRNGFDWDSRRGFFPVAPGAN